MNGLYGTSPWGRQGIYNMDDAEREAIEDGIPDGFSITVAAETTPGIWTVRLNQNGYTIDSVMSTLSFRRNKSTSISASSHKAVASTPR